MRFLEGPRLFLQHLQQVLINFLRYGSTLHQSYIIQSDSILIMSQPIDTHQNPLPQQQSEEGANNHQEARREEKPEEPAELGQETHVHDEKQRMEGKRKDSESSQKEKKQNDQEVGFDNFDQFEDPPSEEAEKQEQPSPKDEHKQQQPSQAVRQIPQSASNELQQQSSHQKEEPEVKNEAHVSQKSEKKMSEKEEKEQKEDIQAKPEDNLSSKSRQEAPAISIQQNNTDQKSNLKLPRPPIDPPLQQINNGSTVVIQQAEKQRISATFTLFLKYNIEYQKTVSSYKLIIKNVRSELNAKQQSKRGLHAHFLDYFETYIKINREFYERSAKVHKDQVMLTSTNKLANIKEELKDGFEGLFSVRKTLTDEMRKLENYIITYIIKNLSEAFEVYRKELAIQEKRQQQIVDKYQVSEKSFMKLFSDIQKIFKKGVKGDKTKEDLFVWIVKFINEEKDYRENLINYGKTLLALKKNFVTAQRELFSALQKTINEFKVQSRKVFAAKKEKIQGAEDYLSEVEALSSFSHLCTITDVDYIKSVLQLQNRKEFTALTDTHFEHYLQLPFFDRLVGNKKELFKGAINKCFPLQQPNEELVHTISGNLVHFNRQSQQCKDKFQIRYLNANLIAQGGIQFDEIIKGILFSDNRTVRIKMKNHDIAEELICYLNERDQWKGRQKIKDEGKV